MKKNKLIMWVLALIFIAPGLCAYLLYEHPTWRSGGTTNKGELISPPPKLTLFDSPKWHLILWTQEPCEQSCLSHLQALRQLRLALGRRYYNVDLWLISSSDEKKFSQDEIQTLKEQDIHWITLPASDRNSSRLSAYPTGHFIATPQQRLILRYDINTKLDDIYQDLKHLLTTTDGKNVS